LSIFWVQKGVRFWNAFLKLYSAVFCVMLSRLVHVRNVLCDTPNFSAGYVPFLPLLSSIAFFHCFLPLLINLRIIIPFPDRFSAAIMCGVIPLNNLPARYFLLPLWSCQGQHGEWWIRGTGAGYWGLEFYMNWQTKGRSDYSIFIIGLHDFTKESLNIFPIHSTNSHS